MREAAASGRQSQSESLPGKEGSWGDFSLLGASVSPNCNYGMEDQKISRPLFGNGRPQAEPDWSPELRCRGPWAGEGGTLSSACVPQSRRPLAPLPLSPSSTCRCSANATEASVSRPSCESVSSLKSVGPDFGLLLRGLRSPDTEPPLSERLPAATGKGWSVVLFSRPMQEALRFRLEVGSGGEHRGWLAAFQRAWVRAEKVPDKLGTSCCIRM